MSKYTEYPSGEGIIYFQRKYIILIVEKKNPNRNIYFSALYKEANHHALKTLRRQRKWHGNTKYFHMKLFKRIFAEIKIHFPNLKYDK